MRSLASRIGRIERFQPPCPKCRGRGKFQAIELKEFDPPPPIDPKDGCELCGKVDRLIMQYRHEPMPTCKDRRGLYG
jgi:hypothetical protein